MEKYKFAQQENRNKFLKLVVSKCCTQLNGTISNE